MSSKLVVALAGLSLAGCVLGEEAIETGIKPIVNGDGEDWDRPHVGRVLAQVQSCTGTLLASRVVVTAGHCFPDNTIALRWDSDGWGTDVVETIPHPDVNDGENDIALLILAEDAPFTPAPYDDQGTAVGNELVVSGFGFTGAGSNDYGTRRSARMVVDRISYIIYASAVSGSTCAGDSGGPAFDGGRIVGINERGNCVDRSSFVKIDYHHGWIVQAIADRGL